MEKYKLDKKIKASRSFLDDEIVNNYYPQNVLGMLVCMKEKKEIILNRI